MSLGIGVVRVRHAALGFFVLLGFFTFGPTPVLGSSTVTLAWDASPDVQVVSYNVYYGAASGAYTNVVAVGNVTSASLIRRR